MCLIIDYKFLNWHLMRLRRVINIPPHAQCSQAIEYSQLLTLKVTPASQSVWSKMAASCPSVLLHYKRELVPYP